MPVRRPRGYWSKEQLIKISKKIYDKYGSLTTSLFRKEIGGYPNGPIEKFFGSLNQLKKKIGIFYEPYEIIMPNKKVLEAPSFPNINFEESVFVERDMKGTIQLWLERHKQAFKKERKISESRCDFFIVDKEKEIVIEVKSCNGRPSGCQGFITGLGEAVYFSFFVDEVWYVIPNVFAKHLNNMKKNLPHNIKIIPFEVFREARE